ncbi:limonene-1,2-epoxide hydrolase family protein [Nocardia macrotermitis]|uniref:Epoxide hydrolase EphG n=1 Tax=Nocardia macrotermitis TaxID=2585198 RepID=A0A7K0D503_9NOCA|nr:limonene-1,2-epoxide hydrolase family protein [Nocardia macrotermitis]MQY20402.1 Epoxide hydrolase EphG [Nocardia macrotermitis]
MGAKRTAELFLDLMRRRDPAFADLLHPDVEYSMSSPTIRGKRNVLRVMRLFRNVDIVHIDSVAAAGDTVLSERIDRINLGPIHIYVWINARLTIRDGQIVSWRDYSDPWELSTGLLRALAGTIIPALRPQPPAAARNAGH